MTQDPNETPDVDHNADTLPTRIEGNSNIYELVSPEIKLALVVFEQQGFTIGDISQVREFNVDLVKVTTVPVSLQGRGEFCLMYTGITQDPTARRKAGTSDFFSPGAQAEFMAINSTDLKVVSIANIQDIRIEISLPNGTDLSTSSNFFNNPRLLHQVVVASNQFITLGLRAYNKISSGKLSGDTRIEGAALTLAKKLKG